MRLGIAGPLQRAAGMLAGGDGGREGVDWAWQRHGRMFAGGDDGRFEPFFDNGIPWQA